MVVVQDGQYANAPEKPLRITGDPKQIEVRRCPHPRWTEWRQVGWEWGGI